MMNISQNTKTYKINVKGKIYTIKNFDYFTTEYKISDEIAIELKDYTIMMEKLSKVSEKKSVIDIGANCGLFCIPASLLGYETFAFEPVTMNIDLLNDNKTLNDAKNLNIVNCALSDFNGQKEIYVPYCSDNTSFDKEVAISNMNSKDYFSELVECLTFDKWLEENKIENVGFIKIDVQGFELNVLKGMESFLERSSDVYILLEWDQKHTNMAGNSLESVYEILTTNGYTDIESFANDKLFYKN